jgi:hypothetical protein
MLTTTKSDNRWLYCMSGAFEGHFALDNGRAIFRWMSRTAHGRSFPIQPVSSMRNDWDTTPIIGLNGTSALVAAMKKIY